MNEALKIVLAAIYTFVGCWAILGTFMFGMVPLWYIISHTIGSLAFLGFSPWILKKLGD